MSAEAEAVVGVVDVLDLTIDAHVHTGFAAGRDAVGVVVSAADAAGLSALTFADQAGPETAWLPAYADSVRRAQRRTEMRLRLAAEVEVVRPDGWLALPADPSSLDAFSVAVSALPLPTGVFGPREVRAMLIAGTISADRVAEALLTATTRGLERASRYAPAQLARPLCLIAQVGLDEAVLTPDLIDALATTCRATGTVVEISEAWRSPSPRVVALLRAAGVAVVPASDARYAAEVGRWQYLRRV